MRARRGSEKRAFHMHTAFVILCRTSPSTESARLFLQQSGFLLDELCGAVEELCQRYLEVDADSILDILDGSSQAITFKAQRAARKWLQERDLHKWVDKQNVEQGVAPSCQSVLQRRRELLMSLSPQEIPAAYSDPKSGYKWLNRFRRRWSVSLGSFPSMPVMSVAHMRNKAGSGTSFSGQRGGTKKGAVFGPPVGARSGQKGVPFSGP